MKLAARTLSGEATDFVVEEGRFRSIRKRRDDSLDLPWIAPGLVDLQINGFAGVDFNRLQVDENAWRHATATLYAHGCTGFLATLITNTEEGYRQLLHGLAGQLRNVPANCLGLHLEGPWLNPEPAYRGAHRAEWMRPPSVAELRGWIDLAGNSIRLITLAPEIDLPAILAVMASGRERDIRFFAGHSAAMGETLAQACAAGLSGWTHLGNAAPATAPKFENVLLHALAQPGLPASLIPDGHHVPPHAFRALARALALEEPSRLLLTTDAMAGAAAGGPGHYTLGEVQVTVGADGTARLPDSGRLAGSTLTPLAGVMLGARMSGLALAKIWPAFSTGPAKLLGLRHGLAEGNAADFCLLSPDAEPRLLGTYHRGRCVFEAA